MTETWTNPNTNQKHSIPGFADIRGHLPGTPVTLFKYDYTSKAEIRETVMKMTKLDRKTSFDALKKAGVIVSNEKRSQKKALSDEEKLQIAEDWIERLAKKAQKAGRLMTDQQLADWRLGVKLVKGTKARYIGPDRNERTENGLVVPRLSGQTGLITKVVEPRDGGKLITFHPDVPVQPIEGPDDTEPQLVDLVVRELTPGWLHLERIPL